jgi:hypothetical protein
MSSGVQCSGREFESLLRYAIPLFPTLAYNLQRFGTPGLNGLRTPRELPRLRPDLTIDSFCRKADLGVAATYRTR